MSEHALTEEFRVRTPHKGEWMHTSAEIRAGLADGTMQPEWPARREKAREWSTLGELLQWIEKEESRRARRAKELLAQNPPSDALCRIRTDGREDGPYTPDQIRDMWRSGKLKVDSMYTFDDLDDWFPVRSIVANASGQSRSGGKSAKQKRSPLAIALFTAGAALVGVIAIINDSSPKEKKPSTPFDAGYVLHTTLLQEATRRPSRDQLLLMARDMYTWRIPRERGYGEAEFPEFYRGVVQAYDDHYK
jgi:hypothetical protein